MTRPLRTPPPGQFRFKEIQAADGSPLGLVTCGRCGREYGRFLPAELFLHAIDGKMYSCVVCDAEPKGTT
jgi:hypothetical protein